MKNKIVFYDKYANKKSEHEKRGEIVNKIELDNLEIELHGLKENQQAMGLASLLHLNFLKRSKIRRGQLNHFELIEGPLEGTKLKITDIQKKRDIEEVADKRLDDMHATSLVKRDKTIAVVLEKRMEMKELSKLVSA